MPARRRRLTLKDTEEKVLGDDDSLADLSLKAELTGLKSRPARSRILAGSSRKVSDELAEVDSMVRARLESLEKEIEYHDHAASKELDASTARLKKRIKFELQNCSKYCDEAEREAKSFLDDVQEDQQEVKEFISKLISKMQSAENSFSKNFSELENSISKRMDELQRRYG